MSTPYNTRNGGRFGSWSVEMLRSQLDYAAAMQEATEKAIELLGEEKFGEWKAGMEAQGHTVTPGMIRIFIYQESL